MDMNAINIKVDPGDSAAKIKGVVEGLTATETRGKAAAQSMLGVSGAFKSLATALQQEQAALQRTTQLHDQLTTKNSGLVGSFGGLATAIQREQSMLEQINGPARKYMEDLTALDGLLQKNAISTEQYAAQVRAMNQAIEQTPQKSGPGLGSALGLSSSMLTGGGIAGGIAAFGQLESAVQGLVHSFQDASDHFTEFQNHAQKFVDSGHDVNKVLGDQQLLAHNLHAPLQQTMDLYDAIGDATSELGLSERQLLAITKNVGEATTIANKPLASAGDILNRLAVSFEAGSDASRSVKKLIADYKDLGDVWTTAFHTSKAGLLEMVKDHKISFEQMTLALATNTKDTDTAFVLRHRTYADERQELTDLAAAYRQMGQSELEAMVSAQAKFEQLDATVKPLSEHFGLLRDNVASAMRSLNTGMVMLNTNAMVAVSQAVANDPMLKYANDYAGAQKLKAESIKGLNEALHAHLIDLQYYKDHMDALTGANKTHTEKLSAEDEMLKRLHGTYDQANKDLTTAEVLYARGKITLGEYNDEIARNRDLLGSPVKSVTGGHLDAPTPDNLGSSASFGRGNIDPDKSGLFGVRADYTDEQKKTQAAYDAILKPQKDFSDGQAALNQLLAMGRIDAATYDDQLGKLRDTYDSTQKHSTDFATGLKEGWNDIVKEATDSGAHIKAAMTGAFSAVEDSIASMVMKGQFDLNSLGSALEQILVKLAVQQAVGGLVSAIGPIGGGMNGFDYMTGSGGGPALPGFATGGDMMVGGAGAPDSKLAMFRVTPGESIHVRTPEQRDAAGRASSSGGGSHTIVNLNYDPKAIASGKAISDGVMNTLRQNRSAIRALLGI